MNETQELQTITGSGDPADGLRTAKRCFSRVGAGLAVMIIILYALTFTITFLVRKLAPSLLENAWTPWIIQYGALYLIALPVCMLILKPVPRSAPGGGMFSWKHLPATYPICVFVMYASGIATILLNRVLSDSIGLDAGNPVADVLFRMGLLQRILIPVIIGPVMEEFIFRKLLIDRMHVYGERLAVVTSAVLFGLFHGNLSQALYATTLGMILGYVYLRSGKLRYSIILHMMLNAIGAVISSILSAAGLDAETVSAIQGADPADPLVTEAFAQLYTPALMLLMLSVLVVAVLFLAGFVLLIVFAGKVRFFAAPEELPKGRRFCTVWLNAGMILFLIAAVFEFAYAYIRA